MKITNQFVPPAAIIGLSFVLAAVIAAYAVMNAQSQNNVLSVTGSAKQTVMADSAVWRIGVARKVPTYSLASGYPALARDLAVVQKFLTQNGIRKDDVTLSTVMVDEVYNNNNAAPREYNVHQDIIIRTDDVQQVDQLSKSITDLAAGGIFFSQNTTEYSVSNLADLRVSLLADAIKDAKARATELAKAGGSQVGALKAASSGVVQVLAPNSIDVSDYGSYDTQSIEKEVMVTARASFYVR